jgi:hypothetical protein
MDAARALEEKVQAKLD